MDVRHEQRIAEIRKSHPCWNGEQIAFTLRANDPDAPGRSAVYECLSRLKRGDLAVVPEATEVEASLRDQVVRHRSAANRYKKQAGAWLEFYDYVSSLAPSLPIPKPVKYSPPKSSNGKAEVVALLSDAHLNAAWGYDKTDGKTEYSFEIGCQLLNYFADEIIAAVLQDRGKYGLWTLHLDILGDFLHGKLRVEDEVTNDYPTAPAVLCAAWVLYQFIIKLTPHFTKIEIVCAPGNHARLTKKPEANRYIEENMETIAFGIVKSLLQTKNELKGKVSLIVPNTEVYTFTRLGHKIKLGHGDHIKGGGGISDIPQYGLHREMLRQYKNDARAGQQEGIKIIEYGHFHDSNLLSNLLFVNGAMCFTSPWALHRFGAYAEPTQWLYYTSEKYAFSKPNPLSLKEGKGRKHPFSYDPQMFVGLDTES